MYVDTVAIAVLALLQLLVRFVLVFCGCDNSNFFHIPFFAIITEGETRNERMNEWMGHKKNGNGTTIKN